MTPPGSVTHWLGLLKAGDAAAAQHLWDRFFTRLVDLAQAKLRGLPHGPADEEDVALSAFNRFCLAAQRGQFPRLDDRDDLWQLLALLAERKAHDRRRHEGRQKRGGGQVHDEAWLERHNGSSAGERGLAAVVSPEPSPEFAALLAEECRTLLQRLRDDGLRAVAVAKMEGYTNEELAAAMKCSVRTIERKLQLIRDIWERSTSPNDRGPVAG
jgi:DNA-directed RNA polymerase specialized sigma24 family protein